ncbi:glucose-6-phosphate exchanger SLC37A4-like [Biomphalaria glabrata]|uniref:Glucose-6-phosphate exchanger SLC37A4-like n=1 Tax=Biomphalaria glabrata TaxID=6526 RepID=A0A9U8DXG7_BIOGL|nr:glucose-6-phosphate exchanger SLC37A4-like [Biomphalaria glabrata]
MNAYQKVMFVFLYVGYSTLVYVRQSVSFAAPDIAESENLSNTDLGVIISSQQLGYTFIKFIGGTLADLLDPGITFTACLILTGLISATFTAVHTVSYFATLWFLCGMAQGPAWSACAVLLKQKFPPDQFATWWSVLSTSANVAGTAGPFISQYIVSVLSWQAALLSAALSSLGIGVMCYFFFKLLKSHHSYQRISKEIRVQPLNLSSLFNPLLILLTVNYLLVSIIRGACNDWGLLYMIKYKGQSHLAGSSFIGSLEVGGMLGSILSGYISDYMVSKESNTARPRLQIIMYLTCLQTVGMYLLIFHINTFSYQILINLFGFIIGFGMYSAISLLGVVAMETAPENLSGTAHSMVTLGGNIGRVLAGYPLSVVASWTSWHEGFVSVLLTSVLSMVLSFFCLKVLKVKEETKIP